MSTQVSSRITPATTLAAAAGVDVSTQPRSKQVSYASYPGNVDAISLYLSTDGISYGSFISLASQAPVALPDAIKLVKAVGSPTVYGGVTPYLSVSGTFQDGQTAVNATNAVPLPLVASGSNSGPTGFRAAGSWQAASYPAIGTVIAVSNGTNFNYWVNSAGLGVTSGTIPAGLSAASPAAASTVTDTGITWTYIGQASTQTVGAFYDGSVVWLGGGTIGAWVLNAATVYQTGQSIAVARTGGGTNYWVASTGGTSANAGTIPTGLTSATPATTVTDNTVTWSLANTAWSKAATIAAGTSVNVGGGTALYVAVFGGITINSAYGPGAWVDTQNTSLFPTGLPRNFSAEYANGLPGDQLYLVGSPDGSAWVNLVDVNNIVAQYAGPSQIKFIANSSLRYLGVQFTTGQATASFAVQACEYVLTAQRTNYIASETGANNAIVGALPGVALADGLIVTVKLAHTLQAGANTFNFNGGGAVAIKSHFNSANNLATGYAATGYITMIYDSTVPAWLDMSE